MALRHAIGDISIFDAGGVNLLGIIENVRMAIEENQKDASLTTRIGKTAQGTKKRGMVEARIMSTKSAPVRVSHYDLSAISIGGSSVLATLKTASCSMSFDSQVKANVGEVFEDSQVNDKDYEFNIDMEGEDGTFSPWFIDMASETETDGNGAFSFALNGVTYTWPTRIKSCEITAERKSHQDCKLVLAGRNPDTGDFPTAPTSGTGSLLNIALNDPRSYLAFEFESKSTGGFNASGSMRWDAVDFEITDNDLVYIDYKWVTCGAITVTASA